MSCYFVLVQLSCLNYFFVPVYSKNYTVVFKMCYMNKVDGDCIYFAGHTILLNNCILFFF